MPRVEEKLRWIRAYEWVGSINGTSLPYSQADFKVAIENDPHGAGGHPSARLVIKRAISECNRLRELVQKGGYHSVILSSKPRASSEREDIPAVSLRVANAEVSRYWLEDAEAETGRLVYHKGLKRPPVSKERAYELAREIVQDISDRGGLGNAWEQIDQDLKEGIIQTWAEEVIMKEQPSEPSLMGDSFTIYMPQQTAEEAPGINAMSSGMALECIEFKAGNIDIT
jgi:hypothetical protein